MFSKILFLSALAVCALAQEEPHPAPEPYSFSFESPNEDGSSSAREETGDANGRITGFYIIKGADGQDRRVDYYADETGFHAEVSTNEIGTMTHEAANARYQSSSPSVAELIASWETSDASRAAASRRSQGLGLASGRTSAVSGSILTEVKQVAPVQASASVAPAPQEGFVLVRASAARTAGLNVIGPEINSLQGIQGLAGLRQGSTSSSSTSRVVTTTGGSLFANRPQRK